MNPTEEQQNAIDLALTDADLTIEALAGCGKTSTLKMISDAKRNKSGRYVAFNRAIVDEAKQKFPSNVECSTAHSLAFKALGYKFSNRLNGSRQLFKEVAEILGVAGKMSATIGETVVSLSFGEQVYCIKNAVERFCMSGDEELSQWHIPVPDVLRPVAAEFRKVFGPELLPLARKMWQDLNSRSGKIRFTHNHYLKMWQLMHPQIKSDFILFDEAQDANGVMLAIVKDQASAQKIFVGDSYQQIYSWNGAINAMQQTGGNRTWLTESWRFGQGIADVANGMLTRLGSPAKLTGRGPESNVTMLDGDVDCLLFRTNSGCLSAMMAAFNAGIDFHVVGGVSATLAFVEGAERMKRGQYPQHPDLNCFENWESVLLYCNTEEADGDIARLAKMIEQHGTHRIRQVLNSQTENQHSADITISTAHKAKGCEWDSVQIGSDFSPVPSEEEKRLLYVAATRARQALDHTAVEQHFNIAALAGEEA